MNRINIAKIDLPKFTYNVDSYQDINKEMQNNESVYIYIKNYNENSIILTNKMYQLYEHLKTKKVAVVDFERYYVIIIDNKTHCITR